MISIIDPVIMEAASKALAATIGKVIGEASIKLLGDTGGKLLNEAGNLTKAAQDLLFPISRKYIENYTNRHGNLKVLGMGKPISLDSVYTKVNFHRDTISSYQSLNAQEKLFRQRESGDNKKRPGLDVANEVEYLLVLGNPGTGKTTFLRKVGLEALKGRRNGEYQHTRIPVLLELRKFRSGEIDLIQAIGSEFENCGLPEYQKCTEELLQKGRLLILLDGLDEVPSDRLSEMTTQIRDLVDKYSNKEDQDYNNRFIVSCRIAAYRNFDNFHRFTDVAIADFDDQQIQNFINKWFNSHSQIEWGQRCWRKLNSGDYQATKELTKTPLLLTLICILFRKTGDFPTTRSTLYEKTLRVLLEEWDASKEIARKQLYQGLDTKRKELMLAQVAYDNFVDDCLFFPGRTVIKQIEQALGEMLPDEKYIDGRVVLREIELQHGVIIERQENTYSFSHLTLQEYLTALHIIEESEINIKDLVNNYICDRRWREVFLILVGLKKADSLLQTMEEAIYSLVDTPKLRDLLVWVERVTDTSARDIKPVCKRAIALALALALANTNAKAESIADSFANSAAQAFAASTFAGSSYSYSMNYNAFLKSRDYSHDYSRAYTQTFAKGLVYVQAYTQVFAKKKKLAYVQTYNTQAFALDQLINYASWSNKHQIYQEIELTEIITSLEQFKTQIPNNTQLKEEAFTFGQDICNFCLKAFHLTPEMIDLSEEEIEALDNYFYANLLMVECRKAAVRVSPETWNDIESRMFLPPID